MSERAEREREIGAEQSRESRRAERERVEQRESRAERERVEQRGRE